jgi:hypothetical protein
MTILSLQVGLNKLIGANATFEPVADTRISSCFGFHPLTDTQRRIVSNMLVMTAFQFRTPVAFGILIKTDYPSIHCYIIPKLPSGSFAAIHAAVPPVTL